jgi:hypothetical protein
LTVSGLTELRLSVPETGKRLLPLPVAVWHKDVGKRVLRPNAKGDDVLVYGQLVRRFYRSGAGARSLTEVVSAARRRVRLMLYASKHQSRRDLQFHLTWLAIVVGFEAIAITIAATGNGALLRLMWFFGGATAVAIVAWAWMSGWSKGLRVASPPARHARR